MRQPPSSLTFSSTAADENVTRCKLLGKHFAGAKAFAGSPNPASAGLALGAHFSRGREKCALVPSVHRSVPATV